MIALVKYYSSTAMLNACICFLSHFTGLSWKDVFPLMGRSQTTLSRRFTWWGWYNDICNVVLTFAEKTPFSMTNETVWYWTKQIPIVPDGRTKGKQSPNSPGSLLYVELMKTSYRRANLEWKIPCFLSIPQRCSGRRCWVRMTEETGWEMLSISCQN